MPRRLFAFPVSELKAVRVVCEKCSSAADLTVDRLEQRRELTCPGCAVALWTVGSPTQLALNQLAKSIGYVQRPDAGSFQVEFVISETEDEMYPPKKKKKQ